MDEGTKARLTALGHQDFLTTIQIIESGYGGVLPNGNLVDRREFPWAMPIPENRLLHIAAPKEIDANSPNK